MSTWTGSYVNRAGRVLSTGESRDTDGNLGFMFT